MEESQNKNDNQNKNSEGKSIKSNILFKIILTVVVCVAVFFIFYFMEVHFNKYKYGENEVYKPNDSIQIESNKDTNLESFTTLLKMYPVPVDESHILPLDFFVIDGSTIVDIKENKQKELYKFVENANEIIIPYGITAIEDIDFMNNNVDCPKNIVSRLVFPNSLEMISVNTILSNFNIYSVYFPENNYFIGNENIFKGGVFHTNLYRRSEVVDFSKAIELGGMYNLQGCKKLILPSNYNIWYSTYDIITDWKAQMNLLTNNINIDVKGAIGRKFQIDLKVLEEIIIKDNNGAEIKLAKGEPLFTKVANSLLTIYDAKNKDELFNLISELEKLYIEKNVKLSPNINIMLDNNNVPTKNPLNFSRLRWMNLDLDYSYLPANKTFDIEKFYSENPQLVYPSLENISKLPMYGKNID